MIDFALIHAQRIKPTAGTSLRNLRTCKVSDVIRVFSEPNSEDLSSIPGIYQRYNKEVLGCFKNYHHALSTMIEESDKDYICILSDDFIYTKHFKKIVERKIQDWNLGYVALFTPFGMTRPPCKLNTRGWTNVNKGWENAFGGNYVFSKDVAKQIINHPFYINHLNNYKQNQQIDHCIPEVCYQLGLDQWYHNPSLCDHIGTTSTIGHIHSKETKGLNFKK